MIDCNYLSSKEFGKKLVDIYGTMGRGAILSPPQTLEPTLDKLVIKEIKQLRQNLFVQHFQVHHPVDVSVDNKWTKDCPIATQTHPYSPLFTTFTYLMGEFGTISTGGGGGGGRTYERFELLLFH